MITDVMYWQLHLIGFYDFTTTPLFQIVSVMQVFGNAALLPLGIGSDKDEKFAIAHGMSVQLKPGIGVAPIPAGVGGGWDSHCGRGTERALSLQPSDRGGGLRHRLLTSLRRLLLLALPLFETFFFFFPPLRLIPL